MDFKGRNNYNFTLKLMSMGKVNCLILNKIKHILKIVEKDKVIKKKYTDQKLLNHYISKTSVLSFLDPFLI